MVLAIQVVSCIWIYKYTVEKIVAYIYELVRCILSFRVIEDELEG